MKVPMNSIMADGERSMPNHTVGTMPIATSSSIAKKNATGMMAATIPFHGEPALLPPT